MTFRTPADFAAELGVNERIIRQRAIRLGACRIIGRKMLLTDDDIRIILEDARPKPRTRKPQPGHELLPQIPGGDYAALVKLRTKQEREAALVKLRAKQDRDRKKGHAR